MLLLLASTGFFNEAQSNQIAASLTAIIVAIGTVAPILGLLLFARFDRQLKEIRSTQKENSEHIKQLAKPRGPRSTDERGLESGNLSDVRKVGLAGHDDQPANSPQL